MLKRKIRNLAKSLNTLCNILDKVYNINSGGCCFLATVISRHLDILGIEYSLVIYDTCKRDNINIEYEVINCCKSSTSSVVGRYTCSHYCLYIKGIGLINAGNYKSGYFKFVIPDISCKNIRWVYKNGKWNSCYNTRCNKVIKDTVKEFFRVYE